MSNGHQNNFKSHTGPRQTQGYRRKVAVARRIAIPAESQEQYEFAVVRLEQMTRQMRKALKQKTSFISKKLHLDYLIHTAGQDLKGFANEDGETYHYKGVK
jgi:hypothetical protein